MVARIDDERQIARRVSDLLNANNEGAAILGLKKLFVEELDFNSCTGSVPLRGQDLPASATRIAERGGVQVVAVRLTTRGRVLVRDIRSALKSVQDTLNGSILLVAGDAEGGEWQLVYPSTEGGKDILRRIVLHRGQPHRTVVEQLSKVYNQARHGDLRAALESIYDVEAVTGEFFKAYKRVFDYAMERVEGLPDDSERLLFCQTLFNRLMFIYFLQHKGWLTFNGNPDYLNALWEDARHDASESFYDVRLRLLFFLALNSPRGENYERSRALLESTIGVVPFLNGGLFAETDLDKRTRVNVPNDVIETLLNKLFRRFNFTITESTPYDIQVAVDPEMLGKVFEELVTGRHKSGSYYTPRPIVSFMCREALKGYVRGRVPDLPVEAVARYVDNNEVHGINQDQAGRILDALNSLTVVDPACGSGAYLLGMMQELLECQNLLYSSSLAPDPESDYQTKLRIIERNVYGVDIDAFAVNIAMLRLWLSLIVEYDGPDDPPSLPNLDFKIACGDSLTGPNPQQHIGDMFRARAREMALELQRLKAEYMRARGERKDELRRQIGIQIHDLTDMASHGDLPENAVDWQVVFAEVFERGGFDIVLANPPYVRADETPALKPYRAALMKSGDYETLYEKWDMFIPFLERGYQILAPHGSQIYIVSDAYNAAKYTEKSHQFFVDNATISRIDFCSDIPIFNAGVKNTIVHFCQRCPAPDWQPVRVRRFGESPDDFETNIEYLPTGLQTILGTSVFRPDGKVVDVRYDALELGDICYISKGMAIHADERRATGAFKAKDLISKNRDSMHPRPYVEGKAVAKWVPEDTRYLEWNTDRAPSLFSRPTFAEMYEVPEKLISVDIAAGKPRVCYDNQQLFHNHSAWSFVPWHYLRGVSNASITKSAKYNPSAVDRARGIRDREALEEVSKGFGPKYVLAIMNSRFAREYLRVRRRSNLHLFPDDWKPLPIARSSLRDQQGIVDLVDQILALYDEQGYPLRVGAQEALLEIEAELDERIDRLYAARLLDDTALSQAPNPPPSGSLLASISN